MIIQVHSPASTTGLKRAFDQLLLLLVEQDATAISDVHVNMTIWTGDKQLEFVNPEGQSVPVRIEPYPDYKYWITCGAGQFRATEPRAPVQPVSSATETSSRAKPHRR